MRSELQDDPTIGPIVKRFVNDLAHRKEALEDALVREDWEEVSTLAHQLSGASGSYGFPEISAAAANIESEAKSPVDVGTLSLHISKFGRLCAAAQHGITRH